MRINNVIKHVDLSKRAVKYYEEKGLLTVEKDSNGYRNYSEENIATLKEISVYRKLGISIQDIKTLLAKQNQRLLEQIYNQKKEHLSVSQRELDALKIFIDNRDVNAIYSSIDYKSIAQAIQDMIPGFYGYYFINHFMPYLQIPITTPEQQKAYDNIIDFWDNVSIKIPFFLKVTTYFMYRLSPKPTMEQMVSRMECQIQQFLNPSEEEYVKLREATKKNIRMKNSLLYKYHPAFISQRKFMKRLQDCGYNDVFIPNMITLSPKYKEYHDALMSVNNRICNDLGLYYDSNYHLIMKKQPEKK